MNEDELKYFRLAKELNEEFHSLLLDKKFHFRGNKNSVSLISLARKTAERGFSNIKTREEAKKFLQTQISSVIKRDTPEKILQSWIIYNSMQNNGKISFKNNLTFITSELVFANKEEYNLTKPKRDIRNDILAIDDENTLCIIELKSSRVNEVKRQTIEFEKVVKNEKDFFHSLVLLYTNKKWNGNIRKIAVWPSTQGQSRVQEYDDVEEVNYLEKDDKFCFN